ncbi:M50 family metallopeptidase [Fusobacterium gonidiaformans]|uniref:M50 family metallopeptidase n=1 Tax=Fusobacterium gonidiaformans TaxID=849 RepID=UPI00307DB18F
MTVLIAIVVLGIIILVHELGHFATAKLFHMPVSEFSIGMGPQVYSYETSKTMYSFRAIPLGGYVNIEGMEIDSEVEGGFASKPAYQRLIVLVAGVCMNFLFAMTLLTALYFHLGNAEYSKEPIVGAVIEESPAVQYLQAEDRIVQIEGVSILTWEDIGKNIQNKEKIEVLVERGEEEKSFQIPLIQKENRSFLGVYPKIIKSSYSFGQSFLKANSSFINIISDMGKGLWKMVRGEISVKEISGPIGILQVVGEASKQGIVSVLWLSVFLSINVGLLNLLPLPALDGGRILFVLLEMLHIPFSKKIEENIHKIGLFLFLILIFFISIQDVLHLF